jgi:hypothetical protein
MIETPWSVVLTVIFVFIAVICVIHLAHSRRPVPIGVDHPGHDGADAVHADAAHSGPVAAAVHVDHLVMSLAMVLMVWHPVAVVGTWVQVVIFAAFAALMLWGLPALHTAADRIGSVGHVLLNAAMIWMLLAMPLLMGHPMSGSGDPHAGHHGGSMDSMPMEMTPTPVWATAVNWAAVVVSAVVALWWLVHLIRDRGHRLHAVCHLLMGAGMAIMLALM